VSNNDTLTQFYATKPLWSDNFELSSTKTTTSMQDKSLLAWWSNHWWLL